VADGYVVARSEAALMPRRSAVWRVFRFAQLWPFTTIARLQDRMSQLESAAAEESERISRLIRDVAEAADLRISAAETAALQRSIELSRETEFRAQVAETASAAFSLSAVADLARSLEKRAQLAEASAKAYAADAVQDAVAAARNHADESMRKVSYANDDRLIDISRDSEARAQVAEAGAKAYADVGLAALAKSIGAATRAAQRMEKRLIESVQLVREQVTTQQESMEAVDELRSLVGKLVLYEHMATQLTAVAWTPQSKNEEIRSEVLHLAPSANDETEIFPLSRAIVSS
jgi:hypothetical protein